MRGQLKTEKQVIKYVQSHAKYYMRGFTGTGDEYAVGYGGRFYHSNDTRCLVEAICKDNNIPFEG